MKKLTFSIFVLIVIITLTNCSKDETEDPNIVRDVLGTIDNFASCNTDNNNQAYQIKLQSMQDPEIIVTANLPAKYQEIGLEIKFDMVSSTDNLTLCTADYISNQFKKISNVTLKIP